VGHHLYLAANPVPHQWIPAETQVSSPLSAFQGGVSPSPHISHMLSINKIHDQGEKSMHGCLLCVQLNPAVTFKTEDDGFSMILGLGSEQLTVWRAYCFE